MRANGVETVGILDLVKPNKIRPDQPELETVNPFAEHDARIAELEHAYGEIIDRNLDEFNRRRNTHYDAGEAATARHRWLYEMGQARDALRHAQYERYDAERRLQLQAAAAQTQPEMVAPAEQMTPAARGWLGWIASVATFVTSH